MKAQSVPALLLQKVAKDPNSNSIGWIEKGTLHFYSNNSLLEEVELLALGLIDLGLKTGERVSILSHTRKEWHLFDLAILCAQGVVVPIYPSYIADEIPFLVNHSESKILVVENREQLNKIVKVGSEIKTIKTVILLDPHKDLPKLPPHITLIELSKLRENGQNFKKSSPAKVFEGLISKINSSDMASIIYTSGTTGEPKGAVITHLAFVSMLDNVARGFKGHFTNQDRTLTFLPLSHVFGRADSMLHLVMNWETVYAESLEKIIDNLAVTRPTIMLAVPRIFEKVYQKIMQQIDSGSFVKKTIFAWAQRASFKYFSAIEQDLSPSTKDILARNLAYKLVYSKIYNRFGGRVRFFVSGGAPLSVDIIKFLRNANLTILEGYGLTETVAPCTVNPISKQIPGSVGVPIGDVQIKFGDDGEILIKSKAMFSNYHKNDEATQHAFNGEWFCSGDIGEFTGNGYLKITDRKKDLIITSGGKNVAPQKIENMLKTQKHISHAMIIGDKKNFLTALIGIEKERFLDDLETMGLASDCKLEEIAKHPKCKELVFKEVEIVNKTLSRFETIKKIYIAKEEFTIEGGHLTPSMKLKKKHLFDQFKGEIDAMYN